MNDNERLGRTDFIEKLWKSYVLACYGDRLPAGSSQYVELRRAFYSGAIASSGVLARVVDLGQSIETGVEILQSEVMDFVQDELRRRQ